MILNSILELFYIDHEIRNKIGKCHECNDSEKHNMGIDYQLQQR